MDVGEAKGSCFNYGKPPWIFKGRALYQLHLVNVATVRACIPKEFKLVEAFGYFDLITTVGLEVDSRYTLGGFFLANYDDSPAGVFDELVVIAGLVWSPPTSCAWAAKVLVNSNEACDHGRKEVGLPSQVATFSKRISVVSRQPRKKQRGFLNVIGMNGGISSPEEQINVQVTEVVGQASKDVCNFNLTTFMPTLDSEKWMGPAIKMSLPSFSGRTEYYPDLLKYSCMIDCRVRAVSPAKVSGPSPMPTNENEQFSDSHCCHKQDQKDITDNVENLSRAVMLSKPILALEFSSMKMLVEAPVVISNYFKNSLATF